MVAAAGWEAQGASGLTVKSPVTPFICSSTKRSATLESGELSRRASKQIEIAGVNFAAVVGRVMAFSLSQDWKGHFFFSSLLALCLVASSHRPVRPQELGTAQDSLWQMHVKMANGVGVAGV